MKITSTLIIALAISGISEARLLGKKKSKKGGGSSDIVVDNRVGAIKTGGGGSNKAGGGGGGSKFRDPKLAPGIPPGTVWPGDESTNVDNRVPGQSTDGDCCNGEAGPQPPSGQDSAGNRVGGCEVPDTGFKPTFSIAKKAEGFTLNNYITGVPRDFECECNDQVSFISFDYFPLLFMNFLHRSNNLPHHIYITCNYFCILFDFYDSSVLSKTVPPRSAASSHTTS